MLRLIVIGVLLFRLTPMGGELASTLISIATDEDQCPERDCPGPDEGCCTTLMHHCGCCHSVGAVQESALAMVPSDNVRRSVFVLSQPLMEPDARDLLRPPAA